LKNFIIIDNDVHYERIYWHGAGIISNCLYILLQGVLGYTPAIILMIFFCKMKNFPLLEELPQKIIPYFVME